MGCNSSSSAEKNSAHQHAAAHKKNPAAQPPGQVVREEDLPHTVHARYKIGAVLGEGGYSVVHEATSVATHKKYAIKICTKEGMSEEDEFSLRQEVQILRALQHPNVTSCHDFFEEAKNFYIVLELLEGGELFDRIVKKSFYNEKEARDLVVIVLSAIKYLHDQNIVHRDLKPENLLLLSQDNDKDIKVADFGFAVKVHGNSITDQCGTPGYMAPEILKNVSYGKPCDMWSFGVILYVLLGGYPPFHDENQKQLFRKIVRGDYQFHPDYWGNVSSEAKNLIRGLLTLDTKKRLTVDQALAHPWCRAAAEELAARNLESNLKELRKYQNTRKFKAAVRAVVAINRMNFFTKAVKQAADEAVQEINAEDEAAGEAGAVDGKDGVLGEGNASEERLGSDQDRV